LPRRAGSAGQDADGHQNGQAGYQKKQTIPAHRDRYPLSTLEKSSQAALTNCRKLIQLAGMPIAIKTARPIGSRSRVLFVMIVEISSHLRPG
jgi:hypothetical protein